MGHRGTCPLDLLVYTDLAVLECAVVILANNGVALNSGLEVIQGHRKWHHYIDYIRLPICRSLYHFRAV